MAGSVGLTAILIVSQFYWPEPIGTPLYVTGMAEWFAARGNRVTVLTGRPYYPEFSIAPGYEDGGRDRETVGGVALARLPTLVPKQERALHRILSEANFLLRAALALLTRRARHGSLEWLFRLLTEPRRLWYRYLVLAPAFLILAAGQMLGLKRYSR